MPEPTGAPRLSPREEFDTLTFTGDLSGQDGSNGLFLECAFTDADLAETRLSRARFTECRLAGVRGAGTDLSETEWLDSTVELALLGAPQLHGCTMRRVRFTAIGIPANDAGALLAGATLLALPVGTWAAGSDSGRTVLRTYVTPPFDIGQYPTPLASFRRYVKEPAKSHDPQNLYRQTRPSTATTA